MEGTIVALNKADACGLIYCEENKQLYYFSFENIRSHYRRGLKLIEGDLISFKETDLETMDGKMVAKEITLMKKRSLYWGLYLYVLKRFYRSWLFYIYPTLVWLNPHNKLSTQIAVSIIYFIFCPALFASLKYDEIRRSKN